MAAVVCAACRTGCPNDGATDAIVALKMIQEAEAQYGSIVGHYATLDCLVRPSCVPEPEKGFLDPDWALKASRFGYRFEFSSGPSTPDPSLPNRSQSAMARFAVAAIPNGKDSYRGFCAEETGPVYWSPLGTAPRLDSGRCVNKSIPVQ